MGLASSFSQHENRPFTAALLASFASPESRRSTNYIAPGWRMSGPTYAGRLASAMLDCGKAIIVSFQKKPRMHLQDRPKPGLAMTVARRPLGSPGTMARQDEMCKPNKFQKAGYGY